MEIRILCILVAMTASSVTSILVPMKRYGVSGGASRFKRPSFQTGFQHPSLSALPLLQQPPTSYSLNNKPSQVYLAPGPEHSTSYSGNGRPFGLPQEQPRLLSGAFTYKVPDADPPFPPLKSSYVSKPRSDYIIRLNGGSGGLSIINRPSPVSVAQPPAQPPVFVNEAPPEFRPAPEVVNVHPPLTSVYVISASSKNEGQKDAFVGLHREPVFGSTPEPGVIKPLTPDVVYTPNQNPSESGRGDEFKPMYIFGPVFYPKSNNGSEGAKDNAESESNANAVLKAPSEVVNASATTTLSTTTSTTTTAAPSSSSDSAGDDSKNADSETSVSSDESSSSSSSGGKKNSGGRGILKVIKGLLGVDELADDLDETNSRADNDKDEAESKSKKSKETIKKDSEKIDEPEVEEDSNSTSKLDDEEEPEVENEEVTAKENERVKKAPVEKFKKNKQPHSSVSLASLDRKSPSQSNSSFREDEAEDKKQGEVNDGSSSVSNQPQQHLETVEHASLPQSPFGGQHGMNEEDPDPIVGPLQIGFISGSPPGAGNQFGAPMQPYFYPAGIPLYNDRPPLNPFSPTGTGFSHDPNEGFEADHTRPHLPFQQPQPQLPPGQQEPNQRFSPEMIQHEQEKIRENFERQRNQQQQQNFERYRPSLTEEEEKINEHDQEQLQSLGDKEEAAVDPEVEQGITVDNKREVSAQDSANSFDHTDRYSETSSAVDDDHSSTTSAGSTTVEDHETTTAYADMKHTNFYREVSPASQTTSELHVEEANSVKPEAEEQPSTMYNRFAVQEVQEEEEEKTVSPVVQSSYATVSTRRPFPNFNHHRYQGHFRPKNRNYVAPTTYRPSYPRTTTTTEQPPIDQDNALEDHKDSSATLYNSINYEEDSSTSGSADTPVIHVEPYGDRQNDQVQSEPQDQMQESSYGSRISNKYDET